MPKNPANPDRDLQMMDKKGGGSNSIAEVFQVYHESPQVLLIKDGACVYDESHGGIDMAEISEQAA